jgi:hypothetical protein
VNRIGLIAVALLLVGCSRTLNLALPDDVSVQLVVFVEKPGGSKPEPKEMTLPAQSPDYRRLQEWFARNQTGWKQAYPTRPTGGVFVHAGDFHLQFINDTVLLFTPKGQFQKKVREADYAFLKSAAGV